MALPFSVVPLSYLIKSIRKIKAYKYIIFLLNNKGSIILNKKRLFGISSNIEVNISFLFKYFYQILTIIGGALMALGGDFAYEYSEAIQICNGKENCFFPYVFNNWICLLLGASLGLFGLIGATNDSKNLKEDNENLKKINRKSNKVERDLNNSREENERLFALLQQKHTEVVKTWLKMISTKIELNTYERLTIYYEHKGEFTLLSRFSQNKRYNTVHNQKFPLNQGVISNAWQHNLYKEEEAPVFHENTSSEYYQYMKNKYGYEEERLCKLTMKSDKFLGIAIQEADDSIGVLLYEKISETGNIDFNEKCDKLVEICKKYQSYLTKYVIDAIELDRSIGVDILAESSIEDDLIIALKGENL